MALAFRAAGATAAGGIALGVSQPLDAAIQVGDLIMWSVVAQENTRGWGGGIGNTGAVARFTDASVAPGASVLNGRSQYQLDDGANPRVWWWIGYRIATALDTGGAVLTAALTSSPAAGVGIASAYVAYANPGGTTPIYSTAATWAFSTIGGVTVTAPATLTPPGNTGTFVYTVSATSATNRSAASFAIFGDTGDYLVVCLPMGFGGIGVWNGPGGMTDRVRWGGAGGPWYMLTWSDGPTAGSTNLGRLPLLGAG